MVIKARGQEVDVTEQINLTVSFKDGLGDFVDADSVPKISIIQPSGLVLLAPTSMGVTRNGVGQYSYVFTVPINGPYGVFQDVWTAFFSGFRVESMSQFVVSGTQMPAINSDGYVHLGDDPGFNYSQVAIKNINKLIKSLKMRLNSSGKALSKDKFGNEIWVSCDIFSIENLTIALATALWEFNAVPYFTTFTFDDVGFVDQFGEILVQGATLYCLASKALIERGREFSFTDNSINFNPPTVSEIMMTQYSSQMSKHTEFLKMIKASLRPRPMGLGTFSMNSGTNTAWNRLRHLRQGRIY